MCSSSRCTGNRRSPRAHRFGPPRSRASASSCPSRRSARWRWRRGRFEPIVDARPGALVAVLAHVSVSGGVAIVPQALVGCVSLPGVAYRPIEGKPIASEVAVAYRRHEKAPAVRAFVRFVRQAAL